MGLWPTANHRRAPPQGNPPASISHNPPANPRPRKQHQRALEKAQRELDRERIKLENQEKKLIADIKRSAKNGQMGACKIQAKDLVRTRRYIQKFYQMRTQLQAIGLRIQTVRSNEMMMQSMKGATQVCGYASVGGSCSDGGGTGFSSYSGP